MIVLDRLLPLAPMGKQRARGTRSGRHYTPSETVAWELAAAQLLQIRGRWVSGPVSVEVIAVVARPARRPPDVSPEAWATGERLRRKGKPDLDNIEKIVWDALVLARVIVDDSQVVESRASRWCAAAGEAPSVWVRLTRV